MKRPQLTAREQKVFDFLRHYKKMHDGNSPSVREVADSYNATPKSALDVLRRLQFKQYIDWTDNTARSIKILKDEMK
jgi:SOS-response transcriptional repressor LexA